MSRGLIGALIGVFCAIALAAVAWFVSVSIAAPDPEANSVLLEPHGGAPLIYAGPGDRVQLDGLWRFRKDPKKRGIARDYPDGKFGGKLVRTPFVPDARKISGRKGKRTFRGTIGWYRTKLDVPTDGTYVIRFESINHRARIYVDGKQVGQHKGEYLPFEVRVPLTAGKRHALVVRANWIGPLAMKRDGWHRLWFNFGGINRGVSVRRIGASEISRPEMNTRLSGDTAIVDLKVHMRNNAEPRQLGAKGALIRGDRRVDFKFPPKPSSTGNTQVLQARVRVENPELWSPQAPNLWDLEIEVPGESSYRARVGMREVRADGTDLLLNGKEIRLRGASIHEDVFGRGDGLLPADQDKIVSQLKALGANATRSQHPLDPGLLERLDAAGIMVWQGIGPTDSPGNWTSNGPRRHRAAKERARTSVQQGQLHPSIITWNLANEVARDGHDSGQVRYIDSMARELHRTDPSRPVALDIWGAFPPLKPSKIYRNIDMIGWTNYIGWYESTNASSSSLRREIKTRLGKLRNVFPDKVIAVTEFGAEANGKNATTEPGGYAFQSHLLSLHLKTYESIPNLAGALIWNLRDFAVSPGFFGGSIRKNVPNIKLVRGVNQKGLFDAANKAKPSVKVVRKRFTAQAQP
ncbi:MAG: glycoside hydrolase family 2 protein [Solirubrobacteraceae bacterium]